MSHARSLGRMAIASGVLATWPSTEFCFTIDKAGQWLTVRSETPWQTALGVTRWLPNAVEVIAKIAHLVKIGRSASRAQDSGTNRPVGGQTMVWRSDSQRELANILRDMVSAGTGRKGKTTMAALFGILYYEEIKAAGGAAEIVRQAGVDSGGVNVSLGCRLAEFVTLRPEVEEAWNRRNEPTVADYGDSAPAAEPRFCPLCGSDEIIRQTSGRLRCEACGELF